MNLSVCYLNFGLTLIRNTLNPAKYIFKMTYKRITILYLTGIFKKIYLRSLFDLLTIVFYDSNNLIFPWIAIPQYW